MSLHQTHQYIPAWHIACLAGIHASNCSLKSLFGLHANYCTRRSSSLRVNIELDAGNSREFLYQWPSIKSALKHLAVSQLLPLAGIKLFIKYTRSRDFTTHKSKHRNFSPRRSSGAAPPWVLNSYSATRMLNRRVLYIFSQARLN